MTRRGFLSSCVKAAVAMLAPAALVVGVPKPLVNRAVYYGKVVFEDGREYTFELWVDVQPMHTIAHLEKTGHEPPVDYIRVRQV